MRLAKLLAVMILILPFMAIASDEGLYDPVAPEGSSFIRFVDAQKTSAYRIASVEQKEERKLEDGAFYSLVETEGNPVLIKDKPPENRAKAVVSLYNFVTGSSLSLKTSDGKIAITEPASYGQAKFRDINGAKVSMAVFNGDKKIAELGEKSLNRGAGYTVLVTGQGDSIKAEFIEARVDTTQ